MNYYEQVEKLTKLLSLGGGDADANELLAHKIVAGARDPNTLQAALRQHSYADGVRHAIQRVQSVYDLQCPVQDDGYVEGARWAHQWWENVLGGVLRDLREQADRLDANA